MAQVGIVVCSRVSGTVPRLKERTTVWQVPGIDGYGIHQHGLGDGEGVLRCVQYDSTANVNSWYDSLSQQQGQIVSVVNDLGETVNDVLIRNVGPLRVMTATFESGLRGECMVSVLKV